MRATLLVSLSSLLDVASVWSQTRQLILTGDGSGWEGQARFWITISSEISCAFTDVCLNSRMLPSLLSAGWEYLSKRSPLFHNF